MKMIKAGKFLFNVNLFEKAFHSDKEKYFNVHIGDCCFVYDDSLKYVSSAFYGFMHHLENEEHNETIFDIDRVAKLEQSQRKKLETINF